MAHTALLIVSPAHSAGWVAEVITLHQHKGKMKSYTTRKTFERLVSACGQHGIVCNKSRGRIELTTPNGGTTAECATVREAWDTFENDTTFSSLPVLPIKLGQPAYLNEQDKATARPWESNFNPTMLELVNGQILSAPVFGTNDGVCICDIVLCNASGVGDSDSFERGKANAALIVKAVNEYEALSKSHEALKLISKHIDDLYNSNKGFMGKLCLQDYALWNNSLLSMEASLSEVAAIRKSKEVA